jgi:Flp pilus assembly protein TadG
MSAMTLLSGRPGREAAVSLIFAIALIPLLMLVGLAVDFGFYNEAQAQLNMAADSAAIQAVRIAVQLYQSNNPNYVTQAQQAGIAWFQAQLGNLPQAQGTVTPIVQITPPTSSSNQITAKVNYAGVIVTHFAGVFPGSWPEYPNWGIAGAATAVISTITYSEFDFAVDNSSSMLIGAGTSDIQTLEALTPCSSQALAVQNTPQSAQPLIGGNGTVGAYSWYFDGNGAQDNNSTLPAPNATQAGLYVPYGYGVFNYSATVNNIATTGWINEPAPTAAQPTGECWPNVSAACFYVPGLTQVPSYLSATAAQYFNPISPTTGLCQQGGGNSTQLAVQGAVFTTEGKTVALANVPQAPCAFACHTDTNPSVTNPAAYQDYFGLARQAGVTLRFDVVKNALTSQSQQAPGVIQTLINYVTKSGGLNPVTVGLYAFNSTFTTWVTPTPSQNSVAALNTAEQDAVMNIQPVAVTDVADTDTYDALTDVLKIYTQAGAVGSGNLPTAPKKYLFLITDGLEDFALPGLARVQGPLGTLTPDGGATTSLTQCQAIKNLGVQIYVLYTTYYPLPNPYYLQYDESFAEPAGASSQIYQRLAQCASPGTDANPTILEATDASNIGSQLTRLVNSALSSPGRLAQ